MEDLIPRSEENELISLLNSGDGVALPLPFEQDIFLYGTEVAGTSYRENIEELFEVLEEGDLVTLIREPENPYDEYAIRLDLDADDIPGYDPAATDLNDRGRMLGYVPRAYNRIIARLMDAGKLLYGRVRHKELVNGSYHKIVVKIYMRD